MHYLGIDTTFPPVEWADEDGLLAFGGDLSPERLIEAYRKGIFPWYSESSPILWWCPNPRFVLFPDKLKVSKSMKQIIRSGKFEFRYNTSFREVITNCSTVPRHNPGGTWILDEMIEAYVRMHKLGYAICGEAWRDNRLVGGVYGIKMGAVFFGESMFSLESNSSKFAFIMLIEKLKSEGLSLIDCQNYSEHLESLGAEMIQREIFCRLIESGIKKQ